MSSISRFRVSIAPPSSGCDAEVDVQFNVQGGGSCFPGDGTSPASTGVDRLRTSREIAISFFMVCYSGLSN